jgi:hypothetical protein
MSLEKYFYILNINLFPKKKKKKKISDSEYGNRTRLSAMKTPHTNRYTNSDFHANKKLVIQNYK